MKTNTPYADSANVTIPAPGRIQKRKKWPWFLGGGLLLLCCLVSAGALFGVNIFNRSAASPMVIQFHNLEHGQVVNSGSPILVHVSAADPVKIQQLELWVNGERLAVQESALPAGISPMPLVTAWEAETAGTYTLVARGFNTNGESNYAQITVTAAAAAAAIPDDDLDGIDNERDACPTESGIGPDGCPVEAEADRDGDRVPDATDDCPDAPGTALAEGCPDRDHDGFRDDGDACPDEPGVGGAPGGDGCPAAVDGDRDGDGVPDGEDLCPDDPGPPFNAGCPVPDMAPGGDPPLPDDPRDPGDTSDRDGDLVPDAEDACPDAWGEPADDGCPDSDGDGLADHEDRCPSEPGPPENEGCPAADGLDSDGDGLADSEDLCPDEPGDPAADGCPAPGDEGDSDGDGIPDGEEEDGILEGFFFPGIFEAYRWVEFQALDFEVDQDYDEVYCYIRLGESPLERTENFEAIDITHWDINAELGSRSFGVDPDQPLDINVECYGISGILGNQHTYLIGEYNMSHPPSDWDGHVIDARGEGQDDRFFRGSYRICDGSCADAEFQPPHIFTRNIAGDPYLVWTWVGNYADLDGFKVYINGTHQFTVDNSTNYTSLAGYEPVCGINYDFTVTAYRGGRESPFSNTITLEGQPCPKTVMITFDRINTGDLGDEGRRATLGPVFGSFWAQGTTGDTLPFSGTDYPDGVMLHEFSSTTVARLFADIQRESGQFCSPGHCGDFRAPYGQNSVFVEIDPNDDLSVGGVIYDQDRRVYQEAFMATQTFAFDEIEPGEYTLSDGAIEVTFWIDVIIGAEVGDAPDLTITGVTTHETSGQFRTQIINQGGTLDRQDVTLRVYDTDDGDLLMEETWENVTITSGQSLWLQDSRTDISPYGITVRLDPDNTIAEANEDNNVYVTPVLVQVQLTNIFVGSPCESFLSCDSEHWFTFGVSSGPDRNNPRHATGLIRYPASGELNLNHCDWDSNDPWDPADEDARFTVEIPVRWNERLFLTFAGYERDAFTDDYMGYVFVDYGSAENFGHRDRAYSAQSSGPGVDHCDDGITPLFWDYFGFTPTWRITRLR